jgi:hypothetical protein
MRRPITVPLGLVVAVSGLLAACGGGGSDAPAAPTTTSVSATVIDGAIGNALVCIDKNTNGQCDAGEAQGRTDAAGRVTLAVPNEDVGKYPILALVGTDATDADSGAVTTAYAMSAPADQAAVVSPLTTLVQQTIASTGASTADAARSVQDALGITASPFADYTKVAAPTDGSVDPSSVARLLVVTTQSQATAIASTLGSLSIDGTVITQAQLDKAIQLKLLELLPALVEALADPAVVNAATPADQAAALLAAATAVIGTSGLTPAGVPTVVAINTQNSTPTTLPVPAPAAGLNIDLLTFTDASNHFVRTLGNSLAQATPDAGNNLKYVERRTRTVGGNVARWSSGSDPWRNADLNWNGTAWAGCPINFENTSSVRDAMGNSHYSYCDQRETGKSSRAVFDIAGKSMAQVYADVRAAGFTNLFVADVAALGSAVFPAGSEVFYQTNTPLTNAYAYYPGGAQNPPGFSNVVTQYSAEVAAGGDPAAQPAGTGCNSAETNGNGTNSTTLEGMIARKAGTPCLFGQSSLTYNGVTYQSDPANAWWGNSTVSLGTVGLVSTTPTSSSTGFYTGNTLLRAAFTGSGTNPVTYYGCKQRYLNGSPRNCTSIGTGSYTITTLGDARVLTFNNLPQQAGALNYNRVFVERGGFVYFGYQNKPLVTSKARMNIVATTALLGQLGLTVDDPSVPLALTAGSYQGTWDVRDASTEPAANNGTTVFIGANGSVSCQDRETSTFEACTVTITNPASGAFTYSNGASTASGTFDFHAGTATGTYHDPSNVPVDGNFVAGRR